MSVPHILLLTMSPPSYGGVAGIFLHDLCMYYPRDRLCCFSLHGSSRVSPSQDLAWMPIAYARRPRETLLASRYLHELRLGRLVCGIASTIGFPIWHYAKSQMPGLIAEVVKFAEQQGVDMVWAVLSSPTIIYIAKWVASVLGVQLVTLVWDPPEYWLSNEFCLDKFSRNYILREFDKTLRASVRCGVVSQEMQSEYGNSYGIESVIIRHGIHPRMRKPPAKETNGGKRFVIGYAGSMYAVREFRAFISALHKVDWRIDGRDASVLLLGKNLLLGRKSDFLFRDKEHIKYLGWQPIEKTVDLMSSVDVTYLPYWFDQSYRTAVRLCFPTKVPTYLASGRPILFHGPEDSSPAKFFSRFPVGLCCHSLEESSIIECLHKFATDREFYASATAAGQAALDEEFDLRVFLRRFATLIGIEEAQLLPIEFDASWRNFSDEA